MEIGQHVKITKPTFLHNGVFILQNSIVEVLQIKTDTITVLYRDKEGLAHEIPMKADDLGQQ